MNLKNFHQKLESELLEFRHSETAFYSDPIDCIDRNLSDEDLEIVSFFVAALSYGRVEQIKKSTDLFLQNFARMGCKSNGAGISQLILQASEDQLRENIGDSFCIWKHRLNTTRDIIECALALKRILTKHKTLSRCFQTYFTNLSLEAAMIKFSLDFSQKKIPKKRLRNPDKWSGTGLSWFAPNPQDKGTCKRMLMWLRWMLRKDEIDFGIWKKESMQNTKMPLLNESHLMVPVDTHLHKWAIQNKITPTKSPNWKMVQELTAFFKKLNPEDPLKYDFMICHQGMKIFRLKEPRD